METVVLLIHLFVALCLIGVVLIQRSEGGGLGIGGGGGGMTTGRSAATAMSKLTWGFAVTFIATSLTLTILAAQDAGGGSVLDTSFPASGAGEDLIPAESLLPSEDLLPGLDGPSVPPEDDAPGGASLLPPADGLTPPAEGGDGLLAPPPAE